jgi:hypothetical protein
MTCASHSLLMVFILRLIVAYPNIMPTTVTITKPDVISETSVRSDVKLTEMRKYFVQN